METEGLAEGQDLLDLLAHEDREIDRLFDRYFGEPGTDRGVRGATARELVDRLAVQGEAKEELVHTLVRDIGRPDLAGGLDDRSQQRRALLAQLDDLIRGVAPLDVHLHRGEDVDRLVGQLRQLCRAHLEHEAEVVLPAIRQALPPEVLQERAGQLATVRKRAATHPNADAGPSHERNRVVKRLKALVDHLDDFADDKDQLAEPQSPAQRLPPPQGPPSQ